LVNDDAVLFLQPEWSKKEEMTPLIVDIGLTNTGIMNTPCVWYKYNYCVIFIRQRLVNVQESISILAKKAAFWSVL
jgi:hypothetical protein